MPASQSSLSKAQLAQENAALRERMAHLEHQLEWFKRQLFGRKSEKLILPDNAKQGDLLAALDQPREALAETPTEQITYERRKKQRDNAANDTGLRFDENVPVQCVEITPPELKGKQAEHYEVIRHESTYRLAQLPASYVVLEYRRPVLKRRDSGKLTTLTAPANVLEGSLADVSFLAGMLVDKFLYHLPLYRQHQRLLQSGIKLSRATLSNLANRAIELLRPIYDAQFLSVLRSRVLAMDETSIKAGRSSKGKMRTAYFWPMYGDAHEVVFPYSNSRAHRHAQRLIGEAFSGVLLSDGYKAYEAFAEALNHVTHAQCWVHTRRYFEKALNAEPQAATEALQLIAVLYQHEKRIREQGLSGQAKLAYRTKHCEPAVRAFFQWCDQQCYRNDLEKTNPLREALVYATNPTRVAALKVFLSNPDVAPDTNHVERALRPIPMGRRAWLFCSSEIGAEYVGIIQSLIITCRLHGVDPFTYLVDVLQRVGQHPASKVEELTPRIWKERFADNPLRSDVDPRKIRAQ